MNNQLEAEGYPPSLEAIGARRVLRRAVEAGNVLVPVGVFGSYIEPWQMPTHLLDHAGEQVLEPEGGVVLGTQDVDVAVFGALTGYAGPVEIVPPGSARILFRRNRFRDEPHEPQFASRQFLLSHAGKLALRTGEAEYNGLQIVSIASAEQFEEQDSVFEFRSDKAVTVPSAGKVVISAGVLSMNPYELSGVESVDYTLGGSFERFSNRVH